MKFLTLFFLVFSACPLWAADTTGCEPAENLQGDGFYFSITHASYYNDDSTYMEVRVPYLYIPSFRSKNIEVTITLPNGQTMTFCDTAFLTSEVNDSCGGTILEFDLLKLQLIDSNGKISSSGYKIQKGDIKDLLNSRSIWALKPRR
jgi:hypothetical protein